MVLNGVAAISRGSACWYVQDRHGEPGTNDLAGAQETRGSGKYGVWQLCSGSQRLPRLVAIGTRSRRRSTRGTAHWLGPSCGVVCNRSCRGIGHTSDCALLLGIH